MWQTLLKFLGLFWILSQLTLGGGCALMSNANTLTEQMGQAVAGLTEMIKDQGVLDRWEVSGDGHFNNPGAESYMTITVAAGYKATGIDGDISTEGGGTGTKLPAELRASLIKQLDGPLSDSQRAGILEILGWNREQPPPGP